MENNTGEVLAGWNYSRHTPPQALARKSQSTGSVGNIKNLTA